MRARTALILLVLLGAALCVPAVAAVQDDATVILSPEEQRERQMQAALGSCDQLQGTERSVCLANIAVNAKDGAPCDHDASGECARIAGRVEMNGCTLDWLSDEEKFACQTEVTARYKEPTSCELAPSSQLCVVQVASERHDPAIITERIEDPEELDDALALYATTAGDPSATQLMRDNYAADMAAIMSTVTHGIQSGEQLDDGFCWGLRGNYAYEDGYQEKVETSQTICRGAVAMANRINTMQDTAESDEEEAAVVARLQGMVERYEKVLEDGDSDEAEAILRELTGIEKQEETPQQEASDWRAMAESARTSCDFAKALRAADELRAATARIETADGSPVRDPWILAHYDAVVAGARRQEEFRAAFEVARETHERALGDRDESALDRAEALARIAGEKASAGCAESAEVDVLLAQIADDRELLREVLSEEGGDEEDAGFTDERSGRGEWAGAERSDDPGASWLVGEQEDEIDACTEQRAELQAAIQRVAAAVQEQDLEALASALGETPAKCPEFREHLRTLRDMGVRLAKEQKNINAARMRSDVAGANARARRNAQAWASALGTVQGILTELERASALSGAVPGLPPSAAGAAAASGLGGGSGGDRCLVDAAVSGSEGPYWIEQAPISGMGVDAFKILRLSGRPGTQPGGTIHGSYRTLSEAQSALDRLCPPARRSTGGLRQ